MTTKNILLSVTIVLFSMVSVVSLDSVEAFAEETSKYKMADDISTTLTFTFRDGIETHSFPVYKMTSNFVSNVGTTFKVQGVVGEAPYLHKALDDAFKYRLMTSTGGSSFEYDFRFFDVSADISKNGESIRTVNYYNCEVLDYKVETLKDDFESYLSSKTGFAIVDDIEFRCGGVISNDEADKQSRFSTNENEFDYGQSPYQFEKDARTFVTFKFDEGTERIEFPFFDLKSGFEEFEKQANSKRAAGAGPVFHVEGTVTEHPLLDNAINQARKTSGLTSSFNTDFEAFVEFTNNGKVVRGLDFVDCRVSSYLIDTLQDKEEGYTGKRGFAVVEKIDFDCAGLTPLNPLLDTMKGDAPVWSSSKMTNEYVVDSYNMGHGPSAVATFTFDEGEETIAFPIFEQGKILDKANPTFVLTGVPGEYPLLYNHVDDVQKIGQKTTGITSLTNLFDASVSLMYGENSVREFNYSDCRSTDYVLHTQRDKESSYFQGFVLTNEFHFECKGYDPNTPLYDLMFETYDKAATPSTNDLRNTDQWRPGFYIE